MSAEFTLTIKMGNSAMQTVDDIAEVLRKVAKRIEGSGNTGEDFGPIMDTNGNKVGEWSHGQLVEDEDEE